MTVKTFIQPSFTTQDAASYKAAIDNAIAVLSEPARQFAPRQMASPGLGITIEAGSLQDGSVVNAANVTGIGAPASKPRIDRVYFDLNTKVFVRAVGAEATTPVVPAIPFGTYLICQIYMTVGMTAITNADIIDERTAVFAPLATLVGGYTQITDADGLIRVLIGRGSIDNRIILRLQTNDATSKVYVQNADGTPVFSIDGTGAVRAKGTITPSTTIP